MTDTSRKRDPRYTRTVGEAPNLGRRYVENGKVRIEWHEDGKRRSRTIGDNNAETRREADEELERLLGLTEAELEGDEECDEESLFVDISLIVEEFRSRAEALMDVADDLAESFEKGLVNVLSVFNRSDEEDDAEVEVEDAEIVDEVDDDDEAEDKE